MGFDRSKLPDPLAYYAARGLKLTGRGKWRTTRCEFHGGSRMRINTETGSFVCMALCGAHGGDVLAYERAITGVGFVECAKALNAWVADGKPAVERRPMPYPPRDALEVLAYEATVAAVGACNAANGAPLTDEDRRRLLLATKRITTIVGFTQ